jgi:hypothetical protein
LLVGSRRGLACNRAPGTFCDQRRGGVAAKHTLLRYRRVCRAFAAGSGPAPGWLVQIRSLPIAHPCPYVVRTFARATCNRAHTSYRPCMPHRRLHAVLHKWHIVNAACSSIYIFTPFSHNNPLPSVLGFTTLSHIRRIVKSLTAPYLVTYIRRVPFIL